MKFMTIILFSCLFLSLGCEKRQNAILKIGDPAPDFKLKDENGIYRSLSEFRGKKVVVYFYPKDDTPGCTKEACSFRDSYNQFAEQGILVIGISYDSPESHKKFKEKYQLPFILLSDDKKAVAKAYNAYNMIVAKRMTYLIDENGKVYHVFEQVTVTEHADQVLSTFQNRVN
jgi:thioredoxin-dependent peroxiredoxin